MRKVSTFLLFFFGAVVWVKGSEKKPDIPDIVAEFQDYTKVVSGAMTTALAIKTSLATCHAGAEEARDKLSKEVADLKEKISANKEAADKSAEDLQAKLEEQKAEHSAVVARLTDELSKTETELAASRDVVTKTGDELTKALEDAATTRAAGEELSVQQKDNIAKLERDLSDAEDKYQQERGEFGAKIEELEKDVAELSEEKTGAEGKLATCQKELATLKKTVETLFADLSAAKTTLEGQVGELKK